MLKKPGTVPSFQKKYKEARVEWCKEQLAGGDLMFDNVLWTDECSVQLECYRLVTYRKRGQPIL